MNNLKQLLQLSILIPKAEWSEVRHQMFSDINYLEGLVYKYGLKEKTKKLHSSSDFGGNKKKA